MSPWRCYRSVATPGGGASGGGVYGVPLADALKVIHEGVDLVALGKNGRGWSGGVDGDGMGIVCRRGGEPGRRVEVPGTTDDAGAA